VWLSGSVSWLAEDQRRRPEGSAASHPFAATRWHEAVRLQRGGINQGGDHATTGGSHDPGDHAPCWVPARSRSPFGQRPDLAVAQAVVDVGEQFAGRGDHADIASACGDDPGAVGGEFGARSGALAGLDRGPAH
jgi:hypothetical protein